MFRNAPKAMNINKIKNAILSKYPLYILVPNNLLDK